MRRLVLCSIAIFATWALIDTASHRWVLGPIYASSPNLWRPLDEMDASLVLLATGILVAVFVGTYSALVRPKSLAAALSLGGLLGVALGTSSGLGTYIHSPIPIALAWGWFILGTLKGVAAGMLLGLLVTSDRDA